MNLVVVRSPWRLVAILLLAVPAVVLSVDILVAHRWIAAPATYQAVVGSTVDANGNPVDVTAAVLTQDGKAQLRRDRVSGALLLGAGLASMGYAVLGLLRPRPVLRAGPEGISLHVGGWGYPARLLPWESIVEVRSGVRDDGGAESPVLSLHLADPSLVPAHPVGAVADPPWLHVWTDDWEQAAHELAPVLDPMATRPRPAVS